MQRILAHQGGTVARHLQMKAHPHAVCLPHGAQGPLIILRYAVGGLHCLTM